MATREGKKSGITAENMISEDDFYKPVSVQISVSISNKKIKHNGRETSLYMRLFDFSKKKGLTEQHIMRQALSEYLDKNNA